MGRIARIRHRLLFLFRRSGMDRELAEEMRLHMEMKIQEKVAAGLDPEEAKIAAGREFGNALAFREASRDMWGFRLVETLRQDVRFGLRVLGRNPGFTAVGVLTLMLGIGATTTIFSAFYGVLLHPLPYFRPDRLVQLQEVNAGGGRMNFADPNFEDIRSEAGSLELAAEYSSWRVSVQGASEPTRTRVAMVSRDLFPILRVQPMAGRGFTPEEASFGAPAAALISYGYWQDYLGGRPDFDTVRLRIDNRPASIIGVMPPGFRFPSDSDIWLPREIEDRLPSRTAHNWKVLARLRDGITLAQARIELAGIARRLKQQYGSDTMMEDVALTRLQDYLTGHVRPALSLLLAAVCFLLLVACANVTNLLLAHAAARDRELAIRAALGAGRGRLLGQLLTEAFLVSIGGGTLGLAAARWGVAVLPAVAPDLPNVEDISVNPPVLLFTIGVSAAVAIALGIFTAWQATSGDSHGALADGNRGRLGTARSRRLGRLIVAAQLASTLVLLVGAGLLGRSLLRVLDVDPGFRTDHVLTADLSLPEPGSAEEKARRTALLQTLSERLGALPGVMEVGITSGLPVTAEFKRDGTFIVMNPRDRLPMKMRDLEDLWHNRARTGEAYYYSASAGYFRALGIPLVRGRMFDERDSFDSTPAALLSESLAKRRWPGQDPLGQRIEFGNMDGDMRFLTVVGIVADVRVVSPESAPDPVVYTNCMQRPPSGFTIVLHTNVPPASLVPAVRAVLGSLAPGVAPSIRTFEEAFSQSFAARRFQLILLGLFAAAALMLAIAGTYGVMTYSVARRAPEIGVRIALGATRSRVLCMVLAQGLATTAAGIGLGIAGSLVLARSLESMLFGVSAADPLTLAGMSLLLAVVALVACYVPARRAAAVDPMTALRCE